MSTSVKACTPFDPEDIAVWPDGFWAVLEEVWLGHYSHRSDDYERVRRQDRERLAELGIADEIIID